MAALAYAVEIPVGYSKGIVASSSAAGKCPSHGVFIKDGEKIIMK